MVPPFIAYFGALEGGYGAQALLQVSYDQCRLYREALRDPSGLWRHIALGNWQDNSHWGTGMYLKYDISNMYVVSDSTCHIFFAGNGWAAAGMLRVLQTLNHSSEAHHFVGQQANLTQWINEITAAAWSYQVSDVFLSYNDVS
jgi:hypothetical protein